MTILLVVGIAAALMLAGYAIGLACFELNRHQQVRLRAEEWPRRAVRG